MSRHHLPPRQWVSTGLDFLKDGLWGRLGVQQNFGSTWIAGAINDVAVHESKEDNLTYVYAGSVNGGVYLRIYDRLQDKWGEAWQPISRPGSGYEGSQSITQLAISRDGQYLAVGQGAPSNWGHVAAPSAGVQIGRIARGGLVDWLPTTEAASDELQGLNISSLAWNRDSLVASSWNPGQQEVISPNKEGGNLLNIHTSDQGIHSVLRQHIFRNNPILATEGSDTLVGMHDFQANTNSLVLNGNRLTGTLYSDYLNSLEADGALINRISLFHDKVDGRLIAFVGSYKPNGPKSGWITRIDRVIIDPNQSTIDAFDLFRPTTGDIGDNQASNNLWIGNFPLVADPYDPLGMSVFVGGNHFLNSTLSPSIAPDGGLVRVDYRNESPEITTLLYGARVEDDQLVTPFSPGQPHADSRSISFLEGPNGPSVIETDDGGIWHLRLEPTSNGAVPAQSAWWTPLSGPGLTTLEVNDLDWSSRSNSVSSSYQDNASSLGYFGDSHATNFFTGDGQVAFFDDADQASSYKAYLSSYQWLTNPDKPWVFVEYDTSGFITSRGDARFYVQKPNNRELIPWSQSSEVSKSSSSSVGYKPFDSPHEENAYKSNAVSFAGLYNVYETIATPNWFNDPNALVVRKLLKGGDVNFQKPTAIDNQGSLSTKAVDSLYVAAVLSDPATGTARANVIYGRQASDHSGRFKLRPLVFSNLQRNDLLEDGIIIDLAHKRNDNGMDTIYWLQGGSSIPYYSLTDVGNHNAADQILRLGERNGKVRTYRLSDLGLPHVDNDYYGYQSLTYIPATENHSELLIISGLNGIWSSKLCRDGRPKGFRPMEWLEFPDETGAGSYVKHVRYNPQDDLLIAGTQGQGTFLYSFSGDLKPASRPTQLLHVANAHLYQSPEPKLDKRGREVNDLVTISLDSRLQSKSEATPVTVTLHDASAWRNAMEMVSAYNNGIDPSIFTDPTVKQTEPAFPYLNILDPLGLAFIGGAEEDGDIAFPLVFDPGVSMFNLQINARESDSARNLAPLHFSVSVNDGSETLRRQITFTSDNWLQTSTTRRRSSLIRDPITGKRLRRHESKNPISANSSRKQIDSRAILYTTDSADSVFVPSDSTSSLLSLDSKIFSSSLVPSQRDMSGQLPLDVPAHDLLSSHISLI